MADGLRISEFAFCRRVSMPAEDEDGDPKVKISTRSNTKYL